MELLKFTPEKIESLKPNEIFVFGSNLSGNHAGGPAKVAVEKFGAIMGQAEGIQGQSYAIPTLDKDMNKISEHDLFGYLYLFRKYAEDNPYKTFYLTNIGCGIAGFDVNTIAYYVAKARLPKNVVIPVEFTELTGFKGFNPNMTCREFQYKVGETYEEQAEIQVCYNGFHFCLNPLDVFTYYSPADMCEMNKFCEVKGSGSIDTDINDSKVACSKIHISAEIGIKGIIDAGIKFIFDKFSWKNNKEYSTGYKSAAASTGDNSAAASTGYNSAAASTGDNSAAASTGYKSAAASTGDKSAAASTGDNSAAASTGYKSAASVKGCDCIALVVGPESKAKGSLGCWIVLTEREEWNGETWPIKMVKAFKVDGKKIKADTWYQLVNGKPIKVK